MIGSKLVNRRTLKLIAIGYAVKTVAFGMACLIVPDLPQRAADTARQAWSWARGSAPTGAQAPASAASVTAR